MTDSTRDRLRAQLAVVARWVDAPADGDDVTDGAQPSAGRRPPLQLEARAFSEQPPSAVTSVLAGDAARGPSASRVAAHAPAAPRRTPPAVHAGGAESTPRRAHGGRAAGSNVTTLPAPVVRAQQKRIAARWTPSSTAGRSPAAAASSAGTSLDAAESAPSPGPRSARQPLLDITGHGASGAAPLARAAAPVVRASQAESQPFERRAPTRTAAATPARVSELAHRDATPSYDREEVPRRDARSPALRALSLGPTPGEVQPFPPPIAAPASELDLDLVEEALADRLELAALELGVELS